MKQCNAGGQRERSDWTNEEGNAGPGADWTNAERKPEARSRLYAYSDCSVRQHPRGVQCRSHTFAQSPLFTEAVADTRGLRRSPGGCGRTGGAHQRRCAARVRRGREAGGERNVGARNLDLDRSTGEKRIEDRLPRNLDIEPRVRRRIVDERAHQRARDGRSGTNANVNRPVLLGAPGQAEEPVHRVQHLVHARVFGVVCEVELAVRGNGRETLRKPAPAARHETPRAAACSGGPAARS